MSAITIVYALNFLYICIYVLFIGKSLFDAGSTFYLFHSFFDFGVFVGYLIVILIYGSEANAIDYELKALLIKIQIDCNEAITLANQYMVYEKDGLIHIMTKQPDGTFKSQRDGTYHKTLDDFIDKNEEVMDKTEVLNE